MAEELNVGRLVAEIALEAETEKAKQDTKNAVDKIKEDIKSIETTDAAPKINWDKIHSEWKKNEEEIARYMGNIEIPVAIVPEKMGASDAIKDIEGRLSELGLKSEEVTGIMKTCFGDLDVYVQYQNKVEEISVKIQLQERKVKELQETYNRYQSGLYVPGGSAVVTNLERESLKLSQLENQFQEALTRNDDYVNKKVAAYQKIAAAAESAAAREIASQQKIQNKTDRSDTALIFADLTTSLRTFNSVSPTTIGNIGTIIRQLNLLRRASQSSASSVVVMATSALAVIGTLTTMAVNYYNSVKDKQEEAQKKAGSLAETYKENSEKIKKSLEEYIELKAEIDNSVSSTSELQKAKDKLTETQNELIKTYNLEAELLDLVNGKLDDEISKIETLNQKEAKNYVIKNKKAYMDAKEKLATVSDYKIEVEPSEKLDKIFINELGGFRDGKGYKIRLNADEAEDTLYSLYDKIKNVLGKVSGETQNSISSALTSIKEDDIDDLKKIVEDYETAINTSLGKNTDESKKLNEIYVSINNNISAIENLSSAYDKLSSDKQMDNSRLIDLLDTYPKLAQYIAETGDLSLESGEKVKEAQAEILKSSIAALNQEKAYLSFKENKTAEEENLLGRVTASLSIYQEQLNKINSTSAPKLNLSDFKTAANDFGNAYKTLADKKELDLSTTLELIEKYPEFAQALNSGSNSVDGQRKAVEKLFETKKKEMLLSLQADEKELQSMINTNNSEKQALETRMQTYSMVASVVTECKLRLTELESKSKDYTDRLNQIKSQISAINNLNIENYKNTEKSSSKLNDKLQEQLKLIEHRRTLNNLTYAEEISWLQMLYREYTETAEERMQLEEKIYTAQQKSYSDLYNTQIKNLEHLKNLDRLNKEQELAWLNTLYSQYVLTAEERMSLEEKIYSVQKEIQSEREQALKNAVQSELNLLEHEKAMDRLSAENELLWLERIYNSYEMSYEDRLSMEEKVHNARKTYEAEIQKVQQETLDKKLEAIEKARSTSRITYEEELRQLRHIYRTQKLTLEQQEQLLDKIRSIQQSAESDRSSQFSKVGEGVIEALKNRYQQQRDMEEKVINDSIDNWKKWEDETVKAIQSQIDALDELANAQESEDKRREYENKRQATELLLKYEKDDYNRKQYQKEINKLDSEENKRLTEERREQQKKELQAQITAVKEQSQTQQDILNTELEAIAKNYEKVMSSYSLENEAYKMMLSKSQNEIIDFIGSYAPEYELTGKTLGEKLYQGLRTKIKDIDYWFQQLDVKWQWYSSQTAITANQAVDRFWASRSEYERNLNSMTATPNVNLTVNFNEPVASPVQVARKMEEVTNNLVKQLKK